VQNHHENIKQKGQLPQTDCTSAFLSQKFLARAGGVVTL